MNLSPSYIVSSMKFCIQSGAVMDADHWCKTYGITAEDFASNHQLARDEITAEIAEADERNASLATLRDRQEAEEA